MAGPLTQVHGTRELRRALGKGSARLADLKAANARVAAFLASGSRPFAPRRTGQLASTSRGNRAAGKAVVMVGNAATPYAGPVHWGWPARDIPAQPWVAEYAERTQPVWLGTYQQDVDAIVSAISRESAT